MKEKLKQILLDVRNGALITPKIEEILEVIGKEIKAELKMESNYKILNKNMEETEIKIIDESGDEKMLWETIGKPR